MPSLLNPLKKKEQYRPTGIRDFGMKKAVRLEDFYLPQGRV
jgi:hypothetical protein